MPLITSHLLVLVLSYWVLETGLSMEQSFKYLITIIIQNLHAVFLLCSVSQSSMTLCGPMDCSLPRLLCHWNFPDKNTGVGCHSLLQGIFPLKDWTHISCISCISRWFFITSATQEGPCCFYYFLYCFQALN